MRSYEILKKTYYDSIILSLLKRNILSLTEAVNCLNEINKEKEASKDLNKDFTMVKQQGLTNTSTGKPVKEVSPNE